MSQSLKGKTLVDGVLLSRIKRISNADTPYTVLDTDFLLECDTSGGVITVNLPKLADSKKNGMGRELWLKQVDGSNSVTIDGDAAEQIDGSATHVMTADNDCVGLRAGTDDWLILSQPTELDSADIAAGAIDNAHMAANSVDSDQYVDGSIDNVHLADDAVDSEELADGAVDAVHLSVLRARSVASDGALTLAATDEFIELVGSASGAKAATMTATHDGHSIRIVLAAASGGSYTLACDFPSGTSGTATLDAAGEGVHLVRMSGTWVALELIGTATHA